MTMTPPPSGLAAGAPPLHPLGDQLAAADRRLADAGACLAACVALGPSRLVDDAIVALTGGLLADLARQLTGGEATAALLCAQPALRDHCHALAIEWRVGQALAADRGMDPLLPPLFAQIRHADADPDHAGAVAALLAAELRWHDRMRLMRLPLSDLPADCAQLARAVARAAATNPASTPEPAPPPPARFALQHRVLAGLGDRAGEALALDRAGLSLFVTALALAAGCMRETVVLALAEDDPLRLALLLRAAGLPRDAALAQMLALRPDAPAGVIDAIADATSARALIARGAAL